MEQNSTDRSTADNLAAMLLALTKEQRQRTIDQVRQLPQR